MNSTERLAAERLAADGRKGTRDSKRNAALTLAAVAAQSGRCVWCQQPLDTEDTDYWQQVQLDRLASGRALGRCTCSGPCRCCYLPGNVTAAHRACHDPERGARGMLTEQQEHALAAAYAPSADSVTAALARVRVQRGRDADATASALRYARAAADALLG